MQERIRSWLTAVVSPCPVECADFFHERPGKSAPKWALLVRCSPRQEGYGMEELSAAGLQVRTADSSLQTLTLIDLTPLPLELRERVCFPGGGEVMLSKWAKISGSSSCSSPPLPSPPRPVHSLKSVCCVCVCVCPLSQPLLSSLSHSSVPSISALNLCLVKGSSSFVDTTTRKLFRPTVWSSALSVCIHTDRRIFGVGGKQLQAIDSFITSVSYLLQCVSVDQLYLNALFIYGLELAWQVCYWCFYRVFIEVNFSEKQ